MEYQDLPAPCWQMDLSEMFVLISLIFTCLQRFFALLMDMDRLMAPVLRAEYALVLAPGTQQHPLARVPAPTPRLTI